VIYDGEAERVTQEGSKSIRTNRILTAVS